jgi:hypothetical protein
MFRFHSEKAFKSSVVTINLMWFSKVLSFIGKSKGAKVCIVGFHESQLLVKLRQEITSARELRPV